MHFLSINLKNPLTNKSCASKILTTTKQSVAVCVLSPSRFCPTQVNKIFLWEYYVLILERGHFLCPRFDFSGKEVL